MVGFITCQSATCLKSFAGLRPNTRHFISAVMGLSALVYQFDYKAVYAVTLAGVALFALVVADKAVGGARFQFVTAACLLFNFARLVGSFLL